MNSTILIVEDECLLSMALRRTFETLGFDVVGTATTYESAVCLAFGLHPDLIVMDINLASERNGVDAAHTIRSFSDAPIIFHSSLGNPGEQHLQSNISNTRFSTKTTAHNHWYSTLSHFFNLPQTLAA